MLAGRCRIRNSRAQGSISEYDSKSRSNSQKLAFGVPLLLRQELFQRVFFERDAPARGVIALLIEHHNLNEGLVQIQPDRVALKLFPLRWMVFTVLSPFKVFGTTFDQVKPV